MTTLPLECRLYFDSTRHGEPPAGCLGCDVAAEPAATAHLSRLGISAEHDLPAILLSDPAGKLRLLGVRLSSDEIRSLAAGDGLPASDLVVYSSDWCPDCRRAKRVLQEADTSFSEIDIERDPRAEATVLTRSGGRRVVPTLEFDRRMWAFNPEPAMLRRLLRGGSRASH